MPCIRIDKTAPPRCASFPSQRPSKTGISRCVSRDYTATFALSLGRVSRSHLRTHTNQPSETGHRTGLGTTTTDAPKLYGVATAPQFVHGWSISHRTHDLLAQLTGRILVQRRNRQLSADLGNLTTRNTACFLFAQADDLFSATAGLLGKTGTSGGRRRQHGPERRSRRTREACPEGRVHSSSHRSPFQASVIQGR